MFGCSKEPSHRDGSFEYPQNMFWLRNKKINFQLRNLIWGPVVKFRTLCFKKCGLSGLELTKYLSMVTGKTLIRLLVDLGFLCYSIGLIGTHLRIESKK